MFKVKIKSVQQLKLLLVEDENNCIVYRERWQESTFKKGIWWMFSEVVYNSKVICSAKGYV